METQEAAEVVGGSIFENTSIEDRVAHTDKSIKNYALGAMGVGLIPLPIVDGIALTGLQIKMIYDLSKYYGIPFSEDKAKNILGALLGSVIPLSLVGPVASFIRLVPIIGQTTYALSAVVVFGASTYAVGKVFVQHFESGGTFLDFDPAKVKEFFQEQFKEGKNVASALKKSEAA